MSAKKKPYSRVQNAKTLRGLALAAKRDDKALAKEKAPDWFVRLVHELHDLDEKAIKLGDFLWVKETEDSPAVYSPEAKVLCGTMRQLMVRQHKAMWAYANILKERINLGWPKEAAECAKKTTK